MKRVVLIALVLTALAAAAAGSPRTGVALLDGAKVHYLETGPKNSRSAMIFIHGWTCNAEFWRDSISAFPGRRVIAVDLPGHGRSDKPRISYTMDHFARAVEAVMKKARVDRAILVGHSMGTAVARQFYRRHPQKTIALVTADGALDWLGPNPEFDRMVENLRKDYRATAPMFVDAIIVPVIRDEHKRMIRNGMLATPDHVGISAMVNMVDPSIWTKDIVKVPVLAIMAPGFWPPNVREAFSAIAPDIEWHMWSGVSHFLMMDRPSEFNATLEKFISTRKLMRRPDDQ